MGKADFFQRKLKKNRQGLLNQVNFKGENYRSVFEVRPREEKPGGEGEHKHSFLLIYHKLEILSQPQGTGAPALRSAVKKEAL